MVSASPERIGSDVEEGGVDLRAHVLQILHEALAELEIEPDQGIIEDEDTGILKEAAGDRGALLLAAESWLGRLASSGPMRSIPGHLVHTPGDVGARHALQRHGIGDVVKHAHVRKEQQRILRHIRSSVRPQAPA